MKKEIRIAILDNNNNLLGFIDNYIPNSPTFYNDVLHTYLQGTASTFSFTIQYDDDYVSKYLIVGNKLAFVYNYTDYFFNIMTTTIQNGIVEVEATSLSFELLNEQSSKYESTTERTFSEYFTSFNFEKSITLGICEPTTEKLMLSWTQSDSILARLLSLADEFSAEIEFVTALNDDYTLDTITMNVYNKHSDTYQGVGINRSDITLRYAKDIPSIRKETDISDLYTFILLTGDDGLTLSSVDKTEYDDDGVAEYTTPKDGSQLVALQARDLYPSYYNTSTDRFIAHYETFSTSSVTELYDEALRLLKEHSKPKLTYETDGYIDASIGDTIYIEDDEYAPTLYLKARIKEQKISFSDPSTNKTTLTNFEEETSSISSTLSDKVAEMIEVKTAYTCFIFTDNGIIFKNNKGYTNLSALVMLDGVNKTDDLTIKWFKDDYEIYEGKTLCVYGYDFKDSHVYKFEAYTSTNVLKGQYEVTITNVDETVTVDVVSLNGITFKNGNIDTILMATVHVGTTEINTYSELTDMFGDSAYLQWSIKEYGESEFTQIETNDTRLTNNGFSLSVTSNDVLNTAIYEVKVMGD